jgi:hypothetical protein
MRTDKVKGMIRVAAGTALLGVALAGCAKPKPETVPQAPVDVPAQAAPAVPDIPPPVESPALDIAPASAPETPPPTEPSPVPKPVALAEPAVESMHTATPTGKLGVAVDLRFSFEGAVLPNQPVIVHLAAVPRVSGGNIQVSVQQAAGLQIASGPQSVEKTAASSVYRQQFSLTKLTGTPEPLRVLITMEVGKNSSFGYFTIPLDPGTNAQKLESVKQR